MTSDRQARAIVKAMDAVGVKRLNFVTSLGISDEVPVKIRGMEPPPDRLLSSAVLQGSRAIIINAPSAGC